MSVVIGICGINFCSLIADGRLVVGDYPNIQVVHEKVMKVYKINESLLFGGAGRFRSDEEITTPLDVFGDKTQITMNAALSAVIDHIERRKTSINATRFYLIGGKNEHGEFSLFEVQYYADEQKIRVVERKPMPPTSEYAVSCCFPPKIKELYQMYFQKVCSCITSSERHDEVLMKVAKVIAEISHIDESVNSNILTVSVF